MKIKKTTGGIFLQHNKYAVRISLNRKTLSLGSYSTRKEAKQILDAAQRIIKQHFNFYLESLKITMESLRQLNTTQKVNPKCYSKVGEFYQVNIKGRYVGRTRTLKDAKEMIDREKNRIATDKYQRNRTKILNL